MTRSGCAVEVDALRAERAGGLARAFVDVEAVAVDERRVALLALADSGDATDVAFAVGAYAFHAVTGIALLAGETVAEVPAQAVTAETVFEIRAGCVLVARRIAAFVRG